jgi:anti-sigma28 factor (negative regulator of flagellin synthesis)
MATNIYKTNLSKVAENDLKKQYPAKQEKLEKTMDTITISSDAAKRKTVEEATKLASKDFKPTASSEKIAILKKAIEQGKYYVSDEDIADSILGRL